MENRDNGADPSNEAVGLTFDAVTVAATMVSALMDVLVQRGVIDDAARQEVEVLAAQFMTAVRQGAEQENVGPSRAERLFDAAAVPCLAVRRPGPGKVYF